MASRSQTGRPPPRAAQGGLGYVVVLFWLALGSLALAGEAMLWSMDRQRAREDELLFAGDQIRRAIGSYHDASPTEPKRYPDSLEVLLHDQRFLPGRRHLRRVYVDPMTGRPDWALLRRPDGTITGVHSRSQRAPLKRSGFAILDLEFEHRQRYADWQFIHHSARTLYLPPVMLRPAAPPASAP